MQGMSQSDVLAGRYELLARTSSDLEDVQAWTGRDQILDRPVHASLVGGEHAEAALDDARRASLIADPRLPRILDVGRDGEQAYVVTEPWSGTSLTEVVGADGTGALDPAQARAVVGEVATVLEVARNRGVHHLALRPAVVRLSGAGAQVTGLGLDAALGDHTWRGAVTTARTDVVGLARLLSYCLTGVWPEPEIAEDDAALAGLADAPEDLAALCRTVLTSRTAGPRTAGEVVAALGEWEPVAQPSGAVTDVAPEPEPAPVPQPPAAPGPVVRQSVRTSVGERVARPGTPPPAMPARPPVARTSIRAGGAAAVGAAGVAGAANDAPPTAGPSAPPSIAPGSGPAPAVPWDSVLGPVAPAAEPAPPRRPAGSALRFDPTAMTLGIMAFIIVIGLVIAWQTLGEGWRNPFQLPDASRPVESGEVATTAPESESQQVPVIASGDQLDPQGDDNEHPEAVDRAIDLDPTTYWYTRTYNSATYAGLGKSGVGYTIELEEAAPVSTIYLSTNNSGGNVEIRATSPETPDEGDILWSGPLEEEMEIDLPSPVEAEDLVLWFTELPQTPDGSNRVELREISVA
ncbi:hypothetical protein GCM10011331_11170 [Flavimobilis marinus]|uniref:Protein kinase domain-containing protein n=2 Tax=Flavimobilis marinus TaxID=285351 RepID=A0A1I2HSB1_9MICO|nr:hypothetical protein GCM10011331_11170 [Flavimobilis marinus]SFF32984.1 hypothetical protein SAMN04488035_2507 [Flavimobilis marinus]